jgi:hypothetical protein
VNQIQADWFNDAGGGWLRTYHNENICAASSPLCEPKRFWTAATSGGGAATADWNYSVSSCIGYNHVYVGGGPVLSDQWNGYCDYTQRQVTYKITYDIPAEFAPAGYTTVFSYFPPFGYVQQMVNFPQKLSYDLACVVVQIEGMADQCVACLPQNVAYYDEAWVTNNLAAYNSLGIHVVPIIADNTVEGALADVTYVPGTPPGMRTAGDYETVITTGLLNARLVTVPVDGQVGNQNPGPGPGGGL